LLNDWEPSGGVAVIAVAALVLLVIWVGYGACHRQVAKVELLPIITISYPNGQSEQVAVMKDESYTKITKDNGKIYDANSYRYELTTYDNTSYHISWPEYTTGQIIFAKKIEPKDPNTSDL